MSCILVQWELGLDERIQLHVYHGSAKLSGARDLACHVLGNVTFCLGEGVATSFEDGILEFITLSLELCSSGLVPVGTEVAGEVGEVEFLRLVPGHRRDCWTLRLS